MTTTETRPTAAELSASLTEQGDKLRDLRTTPSDKRGDTFETDVRETIRAITSLDAEHNVAQKRETAEQSEAFFALAAAQSRGPQAALGTVGTGGETRDAGTIGELVEQNDQYREWRESPQHRSSGFPSLELRTLITSANDDTPSAGLLRPAGQPILPVPRQRRLFVRDLLASGTTSLAAIPYIRELNAATNETAASAVAEGTAKPEATMSFEQKTATVHKIAAWVPATEEILADAPTLRSYIDNRLTYMVKVREELDLLKGVETGANPTVEGIYTVSGTQTQSKLQSESLDDIPKTIGTAIGKVENVDGEANGIAMNPVTYWSGVTTRYAAGFDAASPFNGPPGTIWGLPVVRTRALAAAECIVADWQRGGQVFQRMGITVRTSDSHDDWFVLNKIAILVEERLAFAIYRPDFFVEVTVA